MFAQRAAALILVLAGCRKDSLTDAWTKARESSCEVRVGYRPTEGGFNLEPGGESWSYGTCVVWRDEWVVTARHVAPTLEGLLIVDPTGVVRVPDKLIRDPLADVVVLHVPGLAAPGVSLSREPASQGQTVFAVGLAKGVTMAMSSGVISGVHISAADKPLDDSIQFDAQLNAGNSGGGIFDTRGDFVALATSSLAKLDGTPGISWGLHLAVVEFSANSMIDKASVAYASIIDDITISHCRAQAALVERYKLEPGRNCVVVAQADAPPLQPGDQVLEVRGVPVEAVGQVKRLFLQGERGAPVPVVVRRMGVRKYVELATTPP